MRGLSLLGPGFGASDLGPVQQRVRLRAPLMLRSAAFHSGSFSLSGITIMLCSGALQEEEEQIEELEETTWDTLLLYRMDRLVYLEVFSAFLRLLFPLLFPEAAPHSALSAFFFWPFPSSLS